MQNTWHNKTLRVVFPARPRRSGLAPQPGGGREPAAYVAFLVAAACLLCGAENRVRNRSPEWSKKLKPTWDDELLNSRLFKWLSLLIPAVIILNAATARHHHPS